MLDPTIHLDAQHKERSYRGLARHYGTNVQDAWLSMHAQLAADLAAALCVLDDEETAGALNTDLARALMSAPLEHPESYEPGQLHLTLNGQIGDAAHALNQVRDMIAERMNEPDAARWRTRLADPVWLDVLAPATPHMARTMAETRLAGMDPQDFVTARYTEAAQRMNEANQLLAANDEWSAVEASYASDLAAFEGWLIARSLAAGDTDFVQAEMRWALAVGALEALTSLPAEFADAAGLVRSRLAWAVGPRDALDLAAHLSQPAIAAR